MELSREAEAEGEHLVEVVKVFLGVKIGHAGDDPPPVALRHPHVVQIMRVAGDSPSAHSLY